MGRLCKTIIASLLTVGVVGLPAYAQDRTGTKRAERREPAGNADRQGAAGQEVDGRATDRQLQCAGRQARHQTTAGQLFACSDGMTDRLLRTADDTAARSDVVDRSDAARQARSYFFGRMASAVPWMKAWIFTTSSSFSLPVKSGMPWSRNGPLNTISFRLAISSAGT
jgi:hypothetical protein